MKTAGRVDDQNVMRGVTRFAKRTLAKLEQLLSGIALPQFHIDVFRDHLQLIAGGRAINVYRNKHRTVAILHKPFREFARRCCFTGTLQSNEHDYRRRLRREINPDILAA